MAKDKVDAFFAVAKDTLEEFQTAMYNLHKELQIAVQQKSTLKQYPIMMAEAISNSKSH